MHSHVIFCLVTPLSSHAFQSLWDVTASLDLGGERGSRPCTYAMPSSQSTPTTLTQAPMLLIHFITHFHRFPPTWATKDQRRLRRFLPNLGSSKIGSSLLAQKALTYLFEFR